MPLSALERYRRPGILALAPDALTPPDNGGDPAFNPNAASATTPPAPAPPSSAPTAAALDQPTPLNGKPALAPNGAAGTKNLAVMPPPGAAPTPPAPAAAPPEPPPAAAPAPPAVPAPPKPGMVNAPPNPLDQKLQQESADIQKERAELKRPESPNSNWAQRLGLAVLSMTKLAPAANQIIHPKWSAEESNYERSLSDLAAREKGVNAQETTAAQAAYKEAMAQQAALTGESRLTSAATRAQTEQDRAKEAADKIAQLKSQAYQKSIAERLKGREPDTVYQQVGAPMPPGYEFIENKEEPGMGWAAPPAWHVVPKELVPFAPGYNEGDQMPHSAFAKATADYNKDKLAATTAAGKPKTAEQVKLEFQNTMAKVATVPGLLAGGAVTDVNKTFQALDGALKAGVITPQENQVAKAYMAANPTPQATGTNVTFRNEAQQESRVFPVINKQNNQLEMRSAKEINDNRGLYAPASGGAAAKTKEAVFQDIHYNIDTARKAIQSLGTIDPTARAQLAYVLRHTDPQSAVQSFLTGAAGMTLTDQQQEAVQALAQLSENALSLRSVAGMGAGSDDLRAAIQAVLPSAKSPSVPYMLGQLQKFEGVVNRLETSVPGMTAPSQQQSQAGPGRGGAQPNAAPNPAGPKKTATMEHIREYARQNKISDVEAKRQFTASGYEITSQ